MIFKKLKLKNVRSYENLEIEFPEGATLLAGDIGSGKTSILLGLQFALFGLQPGQKGSSILRHDAQTAFACLELDIDGKDIILERTIKKSKNGSITQDSNVITIDNSREELSTLEMKDKVIKLLNYPKEFVKKSNLLYKFTVYTPQEEMKSIILEKPEIRLDTLRHIFGVDRYKKIKDNSQIFLQKIKEEIKIKEILVLELNLLKEKFNYENEKKIILAKETNNLAIGYQTIEKVKIGIEERLNSIQELIDEKNRLDLEVSNSRVLLQGKKDLEIRMKRELILMQKQINEDIDFSIEKYRSILELYEKHKRILDDKNSVYLDLSSKISVLDSRKEGPISLKEKVISLENCPTCFQTVGEEHKNKISKRTQFDIEQINRELEQKIIQKQTLLREIGQEKELIRGYESDKNNLQQNKVRYEHQRVIQEKIKSDAFVLERTSNEIKNLQEKIEQQEIKLSIFEKSKDLFNKTKQEFLEVSEDLRKKEIMLATKNKELELLKINMESLIEEITRKEKIRADINHLRSLQDWLEEKFITMINLTEKNVMEKLRNEFSSIFSEWFSMLVLNSLSVRLDEDFTPIITNQDYDIDYEFLSGGERTAVALAYRLSLNKVLNSMLSKIKTKDIVILDEPTDGFASEQIDKMRDIFEQLKSKQTILVSHEQKMEGFVDHVIKIRKDGVSIIQ